MPTSSTYHMCSTMAILFFLVGAKKHFQNNNDIVVFLFSMIAGVMTQWRNFKWRFEALQKEEIKLKTRTYLVLLSDLILIYEVTNKLD